MPAGDRYVEVPAAQMFAFLRERGFVEAPHRSRREVVYERAHDVDPRFKVLVYTSIARGMAEARCLGGDAIRVVPLFDNGRPGESRPVAKKLKRVFRTGTVAGVLNRTLERMREAYAILNNTPEVRATRRRQLEARARANEEAEARAREEEERERANDEASEDEGRAIHEAYYDGG